MTANKFVPVVLSAILVAGASACDLALDPHEGMPPDQALATVEGIEAATVGNYSLFVGNYTRVHHFLGEYSGDNVSLSGTTGDHLYYTYNYGHFPAMGNGADVWRVGYQIVYGATQIIEQVDPSTSATLAQLTGENHFLRAFVHFQLVNVFGRPYVQGRDNPGIPIIDSTEKAAGLPSRNTVGEVYDFIVEELQRAAELMNEAQPSSRASREVAYALLSRVYLYMGENEHAIEYANRVIDSGRYQLADTETFMRANELAPENNPEIIFAIKFTQATDAGWGAIGSMYYTSPGGVGYGEMYASRDYRDLLDRYPDDARHAFIAPSYRRDANGDILLDENGDPVLEERNGFPKYFVTKFSNQEGNVTLSSPTVLRLAEIYLNRAEANAKLGNAEAALEDVNRIRQRAALSGDALYATGDLQGHDSVLDVVLEERRLELAFEAQRKYDIFRNGLPLVRDYPGTHLNPSNPGVNMEAGTQIIPPDHPRVVAYIPENETILNPNLTQNP